MSISIRLNVKGVFIFVKEILIVGNIVINVVLSFLVFK